MKVEVKVPEAGESITEGVIVEWFKQDGDAVAVDDPLFELETDKVTMAVQATEAGRLTIRVGADEKVSVGQVVAVIDTAGATRPAVASTPAAPSGEADAAPPLSTPAGLPQAHEKLAHSGLSPAVRRLVSQYDLDPGRIVGSGKDGRLTKGDVLAHVEAAAQAPPAEMSSEPVPAAPAPAPAPAAPAPQAAMPPAESPRQTRRPLSPLRSRIAERLVEAQQTAAILTTFNEADMSRVLALRKQWKTGFEEKHGVRLGMMSFFVKAVVEALKAVPQLNAQLEGDEIVYNHYYDIGVAVGTERGLVVPVVRDADKLTFAGVEAAIGALARKARDKKLTLADLSGGVFTISNGGVYGSLLSTPILNPPQSGILGLHTIKKRPIAVPDGAGGDTIGGDTIAIRPMMYFAMSYDHRLVDGKEAVTFLKRIVECIENPERLLLDV